MGETVTLVSEDAPHTRVTPPKGEISCSLQDLVSMERMALLLEDLHRIIKVPIGLVAPDSVVLLAIGWQPICEVFHRRHPETIRCCVESNEKLRSRLVGGKAVAEKCANGLWDVAMPITVAGNYLGALFLGQFFFEDEEVDAAFFEAQARRCDFPVEQYMQALAQVPRISRAQAEVHVAYAAGLVGLLAELGYKNMRLAREIQERQQAENALHEGERQYRALVENVPGAVYQCLNDDAYTTIFISESIEDFTGFNAQTMIQEGTSLAALIHPEDLPTVHDTVTQTVARKMPYVLNYRMKRKDGTYAWVEERGQGVWDETNELRFLQGVIFDVSERRQIEEERRKLDEQMTRAHKLESLGVLAGGIAHDFNNLLVAILGHADLVFEEAQPGTETYESINAIIQAAQRAANLTRQMLAYSGKGHFMVEPVNLAAYVESLAPYFETVVAGTHALRYALSEDLPLIYADAQQIKQLLTNLMINAAEAYEDDTGEICVGTGVRRCDASFIAATYHNDHHAPGDYVFVEVKDTGCGMTEETRKRLCDPFFSTKFTGRGLGMAAVLGIVRGHKGLLYVESAPGKGTAIQALFPVSPPSQQRQAAPRDIKKAQGKGRILLIDDEMIVRNVARKMLERAEFGVFVAQSGWEALQLLEQHPDEIACIILDLTMPNMDGAKTLQAIRERGVDIPVILSSGYGEEEATSRLNKHHIAAFLQKPYKASVLVETLQRVLQ